MNPLSLTSSIELLERLHEDLLDVLVLTSDEIKKDRKKILLAKVHGLLEDYGLILDQSALFKIEYYLIRNFVGWSRIDPLMKDSRLEDISCDGSRIPIFLSHREHRNIKTNIAFEADVPQLSGYHPCTAFGQTYLERLADAGCHTA